MNHKIYVTYYHLDKWDSLLPILEEKKWELTPLEKAELDFKHSIILICPIETQENIQLIKQLKSKLMGRISIIGLANKLSETKDIIDYLDDIIIGTSEIDILPTKLKKLYQIKEQKEKLNALEFQYSRNKRDLELAQHIQEMILQETPPSWPNLDINVEFRTSGDIGGDLWDFQVMSNGYLGIFLGDVSGHGIGSALIASMTKIIFKTFSREISNPCWFLSRLNELMVDMLMPVEKFITAFYGIFNGYTFNYANAGHIPPLLYSPEKDSFQELHNTSCILGYTNGIPMESNTVNVSPGDVLVIFTDGLIEIKTPKNQILGSQVLKEFIRDNYQHKNLASQIMEFCLSQAHEQHLDDDITLLVIRIK